VFLPEDAVRGELRFEDVSYRYPDGDVDVLSDVDIVLAPGRTVAVVGETGSGKSTLATLAVRLADPTVGRVTLDGVDLRDLAPDDLARTVGVVSQETYLAHTSIRENLLQARPGAGEEDLWEALRAAQVARVVEELPAGLDTVVGARGHRFSGGERQRVAIARTLLANPRVLVLDEATSALDTETERDLRQALETLVRGRTTLTIAHRLSTVRDADEIVVLDHGRVVERGSHADLVAAGGRYAHLAR
jgi:ATP-binding cassette subfamily B protein